MQLKGNLNTQKHTHKHHAILAIAKKKIEKILKKRNEEKNLTYLLP